MFLFQDNIETGALMIFIGSVFDFLDGFAARVLKVKSELGKQLDSLADMVTFGVLPALILVHLSSQVTDGVLIYFPLVIVLSAAVRLGKFNIDTKQTEYFVGLPTPAMALLVGSLPFIVSEEHVTGTYSVYTLIGLSFFLALMMVSEIKLLSFKFSRLNWRGNEARYILILAFLILAFYFSFLAAPLVFTLYLILSLFSKFPKAQDNP